MINTNHSCLCGSDIICPILVNSLLLLVQVSLVMLLCYGLYVDVPPATFTLTHRAKQYLSSCGVKTHQYPAIFITKLFRYQVVRCNPLIVYSKQLWFVFYVYVCTGVNL